jgi:hypothetical protein
MQQEPTPAEQEFRDWLGEAIEAKAEREHERMLVQDYVGVRVSGAALMVQRADDTILQVIITERGARARGGTS